MSVGSRRIINNNNNRNETQRSMPGKESGPGSVSHRFMGERIPATAWTDKSYRGQGQGQKQDRYQRNSRHDDGRV